MDQEQFGRFWVVKLQLYRDINDDVPLKELPTSNIMAKRLHVHEIAIKTRL